VIKIVKDLGSHNIMAGTTKYVVDCERLTKKNGFYYAFNVYGRFNEKTQNQRFYGAYGYMADNLKEAHNLLRKELKKTYG